jgi:hypothetical protein
MRKEWQNQMPLMAHIQNHPQNKYLAVMNVKSKKQRKTAYTDLLEIVNSVLRYSSAAMI